MKLRESCLYPLRTFIRYDPLMDEAAKNGDDSNEEIIPRTTKPQYCGGRQRNESSQFATRYVNVKLLNNYEVRIQNTEPAIGDLFAKEC